MTDIKKCVVYCRVSSNRQLKEGFSIPAQKRYLNEFAKSKRYVIVESFEDDETAGKTGRAGFLKMVSFLKSPTGKHIKTILVEKTDRMYRNFRDYIDIEDLGADIILVKENEVVGPNASSHTKFIHGIKVLMAKNFLDNLSEEVQKGHSEKLEMGMYPSNPMFGFGTQRVNGKCMLTPKLNEAAAVKRIFELYASGQETYRSICEKLKAEQHHVTAEAKFHTSKINSIINNPVYYGDFRWNGKIYKGIHEPIITRALWTEVKKVQESHKNRKQSKRYNTLPFFLKGLMVCGECGRNVTAEKKKGKYVYYRCTKHNTHCSQKAVKEEALLPQIEAIVKAIHIPKDVAQWVSEALKESLYMKQETINAQIKALKATETKLENRLEQIYEDKLDGKVEEELYDRKQQQYRGELFDIKTRLEQYSKATEDYYNIGVQILELAKSASKLYHEANESERLELLGFLLSNFSLKDGMLLPDWKKPFDLLVKHTACSDWQAQEDLNPYSRFWRPLCYH